MNAEYNSLMRNKTWTLVPLPHRNNLVGCKWIYKTKFIAEGKIEKHKAWLVAKAFFQQECLDYTETFAPIAKMNIVRTILSLGASYQWEIHQMDVKSVI